MRHRRERVSIIVLLFAAGLLTALASCDDRSNLDGKQVIVLGFDGMDPKLCRKLMDEGVMPNFTKLARQGSFGPLGTSTPPQSPVAWSSIITGLNPGEHGIFDFIHRDPATYFPDFSTSRNEAAGWPLKFGDWVLPLKSGRVVNLRRGKPFWEYLTEAGVTTHVYRIPANYPPKTPKGPGEFLNLTDMGTPDLVGSVGEFSFYTSGAFEGARNVSGGKVHRIRMRPIGGDVARGAFYGPADSMLNPDKVGKKKAHAPVETEFAIFRDKKSRSAIIEWGDDRVLLKEGEWSDWQSIEFEMGPDLVVQRMATISGLARFHLRQVTPTIEFYVSPIQIDPSSPVMPISVPEDFAGEVADAIGPYYTQGLPEDTQALRHKVLTRDEFLQQAELIFQERLKLLDFALDRYKEGFLFFYFGSTDQIGHMFWSAMSDSHPAISPEEHEKYKGVMRDVYMKADAALGTVMERFPDALLMCVSDHGFADFARGFNINNWLIENGYAAKIPGARTGMISDFDWKKTKAYGIGINGLYINLKGREKHGIVDPKDKQALMDDIAAKLTLAVDPVNGGQPVQVVYQSDRVYSGDALSHAPDMQIGYGLGYRGSWAAGLGGTSKELIENNTEAWCGDHCIATDLVPGVIYANEPLALDSPDLEDLAPTILAKFGIRQPEAMKGGDVFKKNSRPAK